MRISGEGFYLQSVGRQDAEAILDVYRQCEDFLSLGPDPRASMTMVLDDLTHSMEQGGIFCGIHVDGEMAGIADFVPDNYEGQRDAACLSLLMIAAKHRGQGLGGRVVRAVETVILKNGTITKIRAGVQVNNPDAIAFWKRMGYAITGGPELMADSTTVFHLCKTIE